MKKKSFLMAAFAALFMAGCSDSDLNQSDKIIEKDANLYMRVSIANPSGVSSRAGEENVGNSEESEIKKIEFVFYDKEENYIGNTPMDNPTSITDKTGDSNYDLILDLVVPVELTAGMGEPYYVMAYVNPTNTYGSDQQSSLGKVRTLVRKLNDITPTSPHNGFTMTNSVYYDKEGKIVMAARIPDGGLFKSREDAEKEDLADDLKLKINVERIVAKVSVGYSEKVTADNIDGSNEKNKVGSGTNEHTLKFKPLAWGLNNLEKYTFLVKNFRTKDNMKGKVMDDGEEEPDRLATVTNQSYDNAKKAIGSWDWNASDKFRSYWAYSPTYFAGGKYPSTASQYQSVKKDDDAYSLKYHTFDDFYNVEDNEVGDYGRQIDKNECIYTLENTCEAEVFANQAQRALTSVVVVGQYYVDNATTPQTFYLRRIDKEIYYYTDTDLQTAFIEMNNELQYIGTMVDEKFTPLGKWEDTDFAIEHPEKEITGTYDAPSRYVTIKLKNASGNYYYKNGNGQPTKIQDSNLAEANAALYNTLAANNLGGIIKFNEGRAYFNLPIKHHITDDTSSTATGAYGVVRNHAYVLNLKGIDGIGIGVATPDDPIIVPVEKQEFHVRTELNVLNWTVISQNNVILKN